MARKFVIDAELVISKGEQVLLNRRRLELLRQIRETGSILAASKQMSMSYQQAWNYIREINFLAPVPVVVRKRGGANGGGASVTKYGLTLIGRILRIEERHQEFLSLLNDDLDECFL